MSGSTALDCVDLVLGFAGRVVSECPSLVVARGTVVGLTGPNGCGKTTLLNVVSGWQAPLRGAASIGGCSVIGMDPSRVARLGVRRSFQGGRVLEDRSLLEQMALCRAGQDAVELGVLLDQFALKRWMKRAKASLSSFQSAAKIDSQALQTLSGGFQRFSDTLACLYGASQLCALDEPFAGLAEDLREEVQSAIAHCTSSGAGVLVVDHDRERLSSVAQAIYTFRVVQNGVFHLERSS